jgi:hypothetical protein
MKNVKEIKVSSIDELKEALNGIAEDVIAHIEEERESIEKKVHTPFYITLDDIFEASAKAMAEKKNDLDWDEMNLIAKHISDMANIIEDKFIPVPDEEPEEVEEPKEEKLPGYKRRLKIEYRQLKRRYRRLHKMINKYEAGTLEFELNCPIDLLKRQKKAMGEYLNCLELRAEIENVTLEEE